MFYIGFFMKKNERFAHSLIFGERCEQPKMSDVSESLRSLTKNERPGAICSGHSLKMSDHERIAQVAHQK